MSQNTLLISDAMIKERTVVHGNIDPKLIYPDIKMAQDMYIMPTLGTALFNKLQSIVADGSITQPQNAQYKNLIDAYLVDTLMYYTLAELPTTISFQFANKGVTRIHGDNTDLPSMTDLVDLSNKYRKRAEWYAQRMRLFILQNAKLYFPEYLNPGSTIDTVTPEQRNFTMPVYLGGDYDDWRHRNRDYDPDNPYFNRGGFNGQPYGS